MPRTPSPPSSPDSVMIIGNDMQVPVSFLRQKIKVKSSQAYENDGGWISWANSPPKPIPALHGPLSLPYARCPSGAEGTIVEGEDLSHMIWGLGIEENGSQSTHSRNNSAHASQKPTPQPNLSSRFPTQRNFQPTTVSHPRHNASPRHQFQDSLNSPSVGGHPKINEAKTQLHIHQRALESLGPRHSLVSEQVSSYPDSWTDVYGMHDLVDRLGAYEGQRGLGLDWQETLRHQRQMAKPPNSLKPSAPVFVPANQQATPPFPRIFVEPRASHVIHPSQRLTAMEIAQQYRDQHRAQNSLPTPPPSSSPQWTTFRPHYTDPLPPLDIHNLPFVQQPQNFVQQYHPRDTHQPSLDPSEELRKFVYDQMRSPELNLTRDYTHNKPNDPGFMHQTPPLTPHVSSSPRYRNTTSETSPSYPGPPPNSPLPPIPSTRTTQLRTMYAPPPSPTSPDPRTQNRNFNRPPRSVPFARMLQRRLSSVPEEENTPPPSPPPKASATARLPRPPSQSLADSFQSRSHSATGLASPSRSGLTPQTKSSAELESDEAGWGMPRVGGVKATVKLPLKTANSEAADSQGEESTKTEGSVSENAWEKENGKPRRKVRGKKAKVGNSTRVVEDNVSPWLAASKGIEAWL
ncbi:hypothetical protein R3P38DRAFT_2647311 [Favolaschia claudopus]|uniref:Uncharacterized protein n=1 Tax=Favolaschia claudopus TaxID=2862362 RepID=A0AAW0AA70_9AGAR